MTFKENVARFLHAFSRDDSTIDIEEIKDLIENTPEDEIRTSSKQFLNLCHSLTERLVQTKRSVSGISLMSSAIVKFQQHHSQLTPLHSNLCLLCLDSRCFNPAVDFLETDYTEIRKTDEKDDDFRSVLSFYYYGGLIYTAIKNFERASFYFEIILTMPATTMSPIMQESYKKYIILNLLLNGKLPDNLLPRYTSSCVMRQRKQVAHSYLKLAQEFSSLNYDKIRRSIGANVCLFEKDENMGLIKQCLTQVHKRSIQRLTKTFLTLPLGDVANYVGLSSQKEAELYILNMIDDGEISARINQKEGMVVFQDNAEKYDTVSVFQKLHEDMCGTANLIKTLKKMDAEALVDNRILSKLNNDV